MRANPTIHNTIINTLYTKYSNYVVLVVCCIWQHKRNVDASYMHHIIRNDLSSLSEWSDWLMFLAQFRMRWSSFVQLSHTYYAYSSKHKDWPPIECILVKYWCVCYFSEYFSSSWSTSLKFFSVLANAETLSLMFKTACRLLVYSDSFLSFRIW